ncbi:hypothetical protein [Pyruvatibacter sp.]|uniref:hypothetical protein n=1 Tax=Pyruvatibacter sp. TaxID=1981328 RepID=UPI0032EFBB51
MTNLIITGLLVIGALAAWRAFKDRGTGRRSAVEEAARRATEHMTRQRDSQTLEPGSDGVYRPRDKSGS